VIEHLLELVHDMPPDLAAAQFTLHGIDPILRALVAAVRAANRDEPDERTPQDPYRLDPGEARHDLVRLLSDEGATADAGSRATACSSAMSR